MPVQIKVTKTVGRWLHLAIILTLHIPDPQSKSDKGQDKVKPST